MQQGDIEIAADALSIMLPWSNDPSDEEIVRRALCARILAEMTVGIRVLRKAYTKKE